MGKKYKELEKRVKFLEEVVFHITQLVCKHIRCEIKHTTQGHWRGDDYVGGDIYTLWCKECHKKIDEVSNRWDVKWDDKKKEKLLGWRLIYEEVK